MLHLRAKGLVELELGFGGDGDAGCGRGERGRGFGENGLDELKDHPEETR